LQRWEEKQPCSFSEYLGLRKTEWINPQEILSFFSSKNPSLSYENFVLQADETDILETSKIEENED